MSEIFSPADHPHRRLNPLTGEHVLVSPHRAKRPWSGQVESAGESRRPEHDPACPLCPGNTRANGAKNPDYDGTFVFANDFAALMPDAPDGEGATGFFAAEPVSGETRVVCYAPDHSRGLAELTETEITAVIKTWQSELAELEPRYPWVQIFENRGAMMGSSQPHPHGQIWASSFLPEGVATRDRNLAAWLREKGENLLTAYLAAERKDGSRIVLETDHWVALVPFWAAWPFETTVLPKAHRPNLRDLDKGEARDLACALKGLTTRYNNLFECEFPYSMGWYFAPPGCDPAPWQCHAVFYPPLLRSATIRKFMVGYEMLAEAQRDITPEQAADLLRAQSPRHYREAGA